MRKVILKVGPPANRTSAQHGPRRHARLKGRPGAAKCSRFISRVDSGIKISPINHKSRMEFSMKDVLEKVCSRHRPPINLVDCSA